LTSLIQSAREFGVTFVYALSPGLDITYSSAKEVTNLKHKLEQVASFGCEAFALLFDDIEIELCDADKSLFQSFAAAQVWISSLTLSMKRTLHDNICIDTVTWVTIAEQRAGQGQVLSCSAATAIDVWYCSVGLLTKELLAMAVGR